MTDKTRCGKSLIAGEPKSQDCEVVVIQDGGFLKTNDSSMMRMPIALEIRGERAELPGQHTE